MKFTLILFILSNSLSIVANTNSDSTRFQKFLNQTEIGVNFNYGQALYKKTDINSLNVQAEYDKMMVWFQTNPQVSSAYYRPNEFCFVYDGGFGIMGGLYFSYPIKIKKRTLNIIYGVNYTFQKGNSISTYEKRRELYQIHSDYLSANGPLHPWQGYEIDTVIVKKIGYEYGFVIPIAFNFGIISKFKLEIGSWIFMGSKGRIKYVDYLGNISEPIDDIDYTIHVSPTVGLNYTPLDFIEFHLGYGPRNWLFGAIRINLRNP